MGYEEKQTSSSASLGTTFAHPGGSEDSGATVSFGSSVAALRAGSGSKRRRADTGLRGSQRTSEAPRNRFSEREVCEACEDVMKRRGKERFLGFFPYSNLE